MSPSRIVVYSLDSGRILRVCEGVPPQDAHRQAKSGEGQLAHDTATAFSHKIVGGEAVEYSEAGRARLAALPGPGYRWDPALEDWIDERPLDQVKADAWAAAKRVRAAKLADRAVSAVGIAYRISKDKDNLIALIASRDAAGTPDFVLTMWMDDDNQAWPLGGAELKALAAEMGNRGQQIYQRSWALREEIEACQSADGVKLIDIEAGWP